MTDAPEDKRTVVVVGPDGQPVGTVNVSAGDDDTDREDPAALVEQPAKVMRIGSMIKQLLEEVRAAPLDEAGRQRLTEIHRRSISELEDGLAPELREELERLSLPFEQGHTPSEPTSCASPRPSWSAGWKGCSTASRPRWSPSRWRPGCSWSRCAAVRPCRRAFPAWRIPGRAGPARRRHQPDRPVPVTRRPIGHPSRVTPDR